MGCFVSTVATTFARRDDIVTPLPLMRLRSSLNDLVFISYVIENVGMFKVETMFLASVFCLVDIAVGPLAASVSGASGFEASDLDVVRTVFSCGTIFFSF